jgi:hypothetical protein
MAVIFHHTGNRKSMPLSERERRGDMADSTIDKDEIGAIPERLLVQASKAPTDDFGERSIVIDPLESFNRKMPVRGSLRFALPEDDHRS